MSVPTVPHDVVQRVYASLQERENREALFDKIQDENEHVMTILENPVFNGRTFPENPDSISCLLVYGSVDEYLEVPPIGLKITTEVHDALDSEGNKDFSSRVWTLMEDENKDLTRKLTEITERIDHSAEPVRWFDVIMSACIVYDLLNNVYAQFN